MGQELVELLDRAEGLTQQAGHQRQWEGLAAQMSDFGGLGALTSSHAACTLWLLALPRGRL